MLSGRTTGAANTVSLTGSAAADFGFAQTQSALDAQYTVDGVANVASLGDTTNDGSVNSADIGQTKSQSGSPVTGSNFRQDVTNDGTINSADIGLVKSKSGTALP